jgi:hypothetical protein
MFTRVHYFQGLVGFCLLVVLTFGSVQPVYAQDFRPPSSIPAGQVVEGDAFLFGTDVRVDGEVTGDLFAVGTNIEVDGDVAGSVYTLGNQISIGSTVGGSAYGLGRGLEFSRDSSIGRNIYILAVNILTESGAIVQDDLVAAGLQAQLSGDIGRNLRTAIIFLNVSGTIGALEEDTDPSEVRDLDLIPPAFRFAAVKLRDSAVLQSISPIESLGVRSLLEDRPESDQFEIYPSAKLRPSNQKVEIDEPAPELAREFITLLVFALFAVWLFPVKLNHWAIKVTKSPLLSAGRGFMMFSLVIVGAIVLVVLIATLGLLLFDLSMWVLGIITFTLGYSALALALILFFFIIPYLSKLILAYLIGMLLLRWLAPQSAEHRVWPLLFGLVVLLVLSFVPGLGWVVGFLAALLGLGAMWLVVDDDRASSKELAG